jgi:acyl-CoA thioesterase-1
VGALPDPKPKHYKVVVHTGDSMVGGGLCKALSPKFQAEGTKFVRDVWEAASLPMFAESDRLPKLMKKYDPDLVLISLGANDILTVHPEYFAQHIEAIVRKVGNRDCYWIGPPPWKGEHGLIDVMREHSSPCKFFDSAPLVLERRPDGIHPTEKGGVIWADALWDFLKDESTGS